MKQKAKILIVEDDPDMLRGLERTLLGAGYEGVITAENAEKAIKALEKLDIDLILTDVKLPGMDGIELLSQAKAIKPSISAVVYTGYGTIESAVRAMKLGASDFLLKPLNLNELKTAIKTALSKNGSKTSEREIEAEDEISKLFPHIIGKSQKLRDVLEIVRKVAPTDTTVLIRGESGTGKEIIARTIHEHSKRRENIFVPIDCGALTESLLESELFGHVKGSFTGAIATKRGLFEIARGGTLFFDEIGDISLNVQAKLLRVLEEQKFLPVGGSEFISTDIRLITATNRNLEQQIKEGRFREDLYYRLNVVSIHLPPLRERKEDIPLLIEYFRKKYNLKLRKNVETISDEIMEILSNHDWPGNVRELENLVERLIVLSTNNRISLADLPPSIISSGLSQGQHPQDISSYREAKKRVIENFDRMFVLEALKKANGNVSQAARLVRMNRANFQRLMRKLEIKSRKK